jgi:hypothetical protein
MCGVKKTRCGYRNANNIVLAWHRENRQTYNVVNSLTPLTELNPMGALMRGTLSFTL